MGPEDLKIVILKSLIIMASLLTEKQTRDEIKNFPLAKPYACKSFNTPSHTSQDEEDYAGFDPDLADIFGDELM